MRKAEAMGGDDIINTRVDIEYFQVVLGVYTRVVNRLRGTVVKWKK